MLPGGDHIRHVLDQRPEHFMVYGDFIYYLQSISIFIFSFIFQELDTLCASLILPITTALCLGSRKLQTILSSKYTQINKCLLVYT